MTRQPWSEPGERNDRDLEVDEKPAIKICPLTGKPCPLGEVVER